MSVFGAGFTRGLYSLPDYEVPDPAWRRVVCLCVYLVPQRCSALGGIVELNTEGGGSWTRHQDVLSSAHSESFCSGGKRTSGASEQLQGTGGEQNHPQRRGERDQIQEARGQEHLQENGNSGAALRASLGDPILHQQSPQPGSTPERLFLRDPPGAVRLE
ncbi:hypothetical protein NDU88_010060 [Pleurodeles waltl]|uniref:Uncharacterized protein n=1 Tax=Pleurodeles waltl TaxID=8319 RepID=A0AAV7PTU8_PLEWA|nr:hypothetical protein NDU88_010060 [Pleurodeles waltl]